MTDPAGDAPDLPARYSIRETMKDGRFTLLYAASRGDAGQPCAVKVVKKRGAGSEAAIRAALDKLPKHRHLIEIHETGKTRAGRLYAAMDWCRAGSLADALVPAGVPRPGRSSRPASRLLSRQVMTIGAMAADALQAAHESGVPHGDLRPAAMLTNGGNEPVVSGFGFGLLYKDDRREAVRLAHWSPALLEGGTPSPADDVYGLATTLTTLLTGAPHLLSAAEEGLAALVTAALRGRTPEFPDDVPAGLRSLLTAALSPDPGTRPGSARELGGALRDITKLAGRWLPGDKPTPADGPAAGNGSAAAAPGHEPAETVGHEPAAAAAGDGSAAAGAGNGSAATAGHESATATVADGPAAATAGNGSAGTAGNPAAATAGNGSAATAAAPGPMGSPAGDGPGSPPAGNGVPREEQVPARAGGSGYRYGLALAGAVLGTVAVVALVTAGRHLGGPRPPHPSPTAAGPSVITHQAPPATKLDEASYQPQHLAARPGPGDVVLTWKLPGNAVSDGAGIVIRESPALSGSGTVALSRQGTGLPGSYIAAPAPAGQQVCFTVGVLVERSNGSVQLIQAGPACAIPR